MRRRTLVIVASLWLVPDSCVDAATDRRAPIADNGSMSTMDTDTAALLIDFIEKVGLLRRDMQQKKDYEKYEARFSRVEQKLSGLAERVSRTDPELAKALRTAWQ